MLTEFEKKVGEYISRRGLLDGARKTVLAVSGGADSTALLHVMRALKDAGVLKADLICAHINHGLRGAESDGDERFVVEQAEGLGLPVSVRRIDVHGAARARKLSIETAAREVRMECLLEIAASAGADIIVTAHQKDDNAETVVQRMSRGTGFRGLGGIWPVREFGGVRFVRPLLCASRREVVEYLTSKGLRWREDKTNADWSFRRNYIRHRLLPALQEECGSVLIDELCELSDKARRFYGAVCDAAERVWPLLAEESDAELKVNSERLLRENAAVQVEIVRRGLEWAGSGERDLTEEHYKRILELAHRMAGGKSLQLPGGFEVRREYGNLIFLRAGGGGPLGTRAEEIQINVPGQTLVGDCRVEAKILEFSAEGFEKFKAAKTGETEWFDLEKLRLPLYIRGRKVGDRFVPLGQDGEKKVGKFLTASRIARRVREKMLVVCDENRIVWLWPVRMSEEVKVTHETKKVLQLRITESKGA